MRDAYDLIVVGGGASGMMAAGCAAERGLRVLLLEKNHRLGEKLRISGGGRCNITNAEYDTRAMLKHYGTSEKFLHSLFSVFGVKDTVAFFESHNVPIVVEAHKRAFPKSQKAGDVVRALERYMKKGKVEVHTDSAVTRIDMKEGRIMGVQCGTPYYTAREYIFATGGVSHAETGSTGDGFAWLEALGHTIAKPTPTIVPIKVKNRWVKILAGNTLRGVKMMLYTNAKKQFSITGNILCTHFGLSGPLILNNAWRIADLLHEGEVTALIDLFPSMDLGALEKHSIAVFDAHKNKELKNVMKEIVPGGIQKGILQLLAEKIDTSTKVHSIRKDDRKYMVRLLKAMPVRVEGLMGFDRAVVADGGLPLTEIDMKTMRSKKIPNLLITGDLLHINRPSGGYSLQLCWSTGYAAGSNAGVK